MLSILLDMSETYQQATLLLECTKTFQLAGSAVMVNLELQGPDTTIKVQNQASACTMWLTPHGLSILTAQVGL